VAQSAVVCLSCGANPRAGTKFCWNCGGETLPNAVVCVKCGVKLGAGPVGAARKSRVAAGILGILLGGLGVHRFYLGYITIGIIQIVVTIITCGLGALWGLIEGILILVGNINEDADGNPLSD
jgi:TM2 domain-containing membrane protein YozV